MDYRVLITDDAYEDLDNILYHLLFVLKNDQAAKSVLDDFELTIHRLSQVAGSLKLCENPKLHAKGYRRLEFGKHNYFVLYRIVNDTAVVDNLFHSLQDFSNTMS